MPSTPSRPKKRLGTFLARLCAESEHTLADAAAELQMDDSTVSRYFTGHNRPQWPSVSALLALFGATDEDRAIAQTLWKAAGVTRPQTRLPPNAPKTFRELVRNEQDATTIRAIAPLVVPGLLQTADYARAVHASAPARRDPTATADEFVAVRLDRQKLLDGPSPVHLDAVLDEGVIRRQVGGGDVMRRQLDQLLVVGAKPHVTIRVMPFGAGAYGSMSGACSILSYGDDDGGGPDAYLEHGAGGVWVEDREDVQLLVTMFDGVSDRALTPEDTADLIRRELNRL